MNIVIIDYKAGNIRSVQNMIHKIGYTAVISSDKEVIMAADKLILPGVGAFDYGMEQLHQLDLVQLLTEKAIIQQTPFLGICLGAQLMTKESEEGKKEGLGWFDVQTVRFKPTDASIKVPHMGWNYITTLRTSKLFAGLEGEATRFYFVHSYHFLPNQQEEVIAQSHYGYDFAVALHKNNLYGVQFHPEKSHKFGLTLLKNFLENC
jgi:glutamine amidotransferase